MSDTREKILDLAEELIRTKGYHAFSYKDIAEPLEIKNAAIHYHFYTKEDLGTAVIERTLDRLREQISEDGTLSASEQLHHFLQIYIESSSKNQVCFVGALGPAYPALPPKMQEILRKTAQQTRVRLTEVLENGKKKGVFEFKEPSSEKADIIISSLLASLILERVSGDAIINTITENIKSTVEA